jgi:biopolymer transport protein ExbD
MCRLAVLGLPGLTAEERVASWDVFHGDRLELERGLDTAAIRRALARGELRDDDLVRPAGSSVAWTRLVDLPELLEPAAPAADPPPRAPVVKPPSARESSPRTAETSEYEVQVDDLSRDVSHSLRDTLPAPDWLELRSESDDVSFPVIKDLPHEPKPANAGPQTPDVLPQGGWLWAEEDDDDDDPVPGIAVAPDITARDPKTPDNEPMLDLEIQRPQPDKRDDDSRMALPVVESRGWDDVTEAAADDTDDVVSLSRSGPATVEELDLAPMVDVAFQLVLFFMVTATTVLYKTLEIPKPAPEQAPTVVAQGRSLSDLQENYILVEIDSRGSIKIDREPIASNMNALVERLRSLRESTHRKEMLLSADFATPHRSAVLAYDAANEIGLGIAIARPSTPQGPAPSLLAQPPRAVEPPSAPPAQPPA